MDKQKPSWKPTAPSSRGATAYHDSVCRANYYMQALDELMKVAAPKIQKGQIVVDLGAGTGVSGLHLLKHTKTPFRLWLVDNSPAWLGKAYEVLHENQGTQFYILEKKGEGYATLAETVGAGIADHVLSANTVHLIHEIEEVFRGVAAALKENGTFLIESGNIVMGNSPKGALLIDDTVKRVHEIALDIVREDPEFSVYRQKIDANIKKYEAQRKFVFPEPRSLEFYGNSLRKAGFEVQESYFRLFKVKFEEWLSFLRVKRLQAGILPEVGGNEPTPKEEEDRDRLITIAARRLFEELQKTNPLVDKEGFTIEGVYILSQKARKRLLGKKALVTGGSRGIGNAIAVALASEGADVMIIYHSNEEKAKETVSQLKALGVKGVAVKADVASQKDVERIKEAIQREFGHLDILINNAGIIRDKTLEKMKTEEWEEVIETNLTGVFHVTKAALPLMKDGGKIVNISSIVGIIGNFGQTNYAAAKAGIIGFTKSLAKEAAKKQITVNAIAPGFIESDILLAMPGQRRKEVAALIPLGKMGQPEDVAKLALFLVSKGADYITGEVIRIDGGLNF